MTELGWMALLAPVVAGGAAETYRRWKHGRKEAASASLASSLGRLARGLVQRLPAADAPHAPCTPERLRRTLRSALHGEGLVVVAQREPYIHEKGADGSIQVRHPASGLVTALEPVLSACSGVWVAHGGGSADRETVDANDRLFCPPGEKAYRLKRIWLSKDEERGFYEGFSNEGLWPLCHIAHERPTFRAEDWRHYQEVNRRFAEAACSESRGPDPILLVQDYHFALVPGLVRQRLPDAALLTFWHIPWPNAEQLGICPFAKEILVGLLGSSILGFHTQRHCNNFIDAVDRLLEARIDRDRQAVVLGGRTTLIRAYPISIEWPPRWLASAPSVDRCRSSVREELGLAPDSLLGLGVDRLDYTKGIEERLLAVELLLERHEELRGRFVFVQLADPSRTGIARYQRLGEDVEALVGRINARFGSGTYAPIVLRRAHHEPPEVFRYYRAADVCYVSSLHDGMNLVAKEFVAARDDCRGVLVLSVFAGAAGELAEALVVNPYDLDRAADALAAALAMPLEEQSERLRAMRTRIADANVYLWAERMILDAARHRLSGRLQQRLAAPDRSSVERPG